MAQRTQQRRKRKKTSSLSTMEWDRLVEDAQLRNDYTFLAKTLSEAQRRASTAGTEVDASGAIRLLNQNPALVRYLRDVAEREDATKDAYSMPDELLLKRSPTGGPVQNQAGATTNMGGWAGDKNRPQGVMNAPILREWADRSTWVRIAILKLRRWVERADIAVLPLDETKRYNKAILKKVQQLLDQPNEYRDSYRSLIGPVIEDILILDRGVIEKGMTLGRQPTSLYYQDGALIKIYPNWSGDPNEPRYLYDPGGQKKIPLRNDEAIVIMENVSSWRYGYSKVQFLADTIQADIDATKSAMHLVQMKPPPHLVQIPGATGSQLDSVRTRYDAEFAGRRELMFLGGQNPAHVFPLIFSARDQQWLEWQIYIARKIATIFGIAPQQLGITNDVNRATAQVLHDEAEEAGYIPLLLLLEEYLNREMLADFAPPAPLDRSDLEALNLRVVYPEVSEAARQVHAERAVDIATKSLAGLPSATLNQMLAMRGEKPVSGGDTFWAMTTAGPIPWLTYNPGDMMGDYEPSRATAGGEGAQDAAGGVEQDGQEATKPGNSQQAAQQVEQAEQAASGGSSGSSSGGGKAPSGGKASKALDMRPPGKRWRPGHGG